MIRSRRKKPRPGRLDADGIDALRISCYMRDEAMCQECGRIVWPDLHHTHPNSYHMAHIKAKRNGGDSLENVRTLCGECHRKEHNFGPSMTKPCPPKNCLDSETK